MIEGVEGTTCQHCKEKDCICGWIECDRKGNGPTIFHYDCLECGKSWERSYQ
jgi:DNA-directed RNA polymerase subunit M/transcription elongation factor TFIIS